jgi:hypothetical protein
MNHEKEIFELFCTITRNMELNNQHKIFSICLSKDKSSMMKAAVHMRDIRNGRGERKIFRNLLTWLDSKNTQTCRDFLSKIVPLIQYFGRWDDIFSAGHIGLEYFSSILYGELAKIDKNPAYRPNLSAKWAPTEASNKILSRKLIKVMGVTNRTYRKEILKPLRDRIFIAERLMSERDYTSLFNKRTHVSLYTINHNRKYFQRYFPYFYDTVENKLDAMRNSEPSSSTHINISEYWNKHFLSQLI